MFRLDILQNQWLMLAMAGGLVLVLSMVLFSLAMWRERPPQTAAPRPARRFIPVLLILVYTFTAIFIVVYTLAMSRHPPNW